MAAADERSRAESLTYSWRKSAGTRLYVGVTRSREGRFNPVRATEAFVKLQVDAEEMRALRF